MRRIIIIAGLVLCAVLVEGIVFFLSSRVPEASEGAVEAALPPPSEYGDLLASAEECRATRRFERAFGFVRLALDRAKTEAERVEAGYRMGSLLFEDYRQGGSSRPDAAALYLEAAYAASVDPAQRTTIGLLLLDALQEAGESERVSAYLGQMLSAPQPEETLLLELWRRKFKLAVAFSSDWRDANDVLVQSEILPFKSEQWSQLVADARLRISERLLADGAWFGSCVEFAMVEDPSTFRQELFRIVRTQLEKMVEQGNALEREDALLRLASVYAVMGNHEKAHQCLERFFEMAPTENLTEALVLMSQVSRVRGEVAYVTRLAEELVRRFDFSVHTQEELLQVLALLEEHKLYAEALGLLEACLFLVESPGKEYGRLLGKAAVLEERLGHRANALDYMHQLSALGNDAYFEDAFSGLIGVNLAASNYEAVESLVQRYLSRLRPNTKTFEDALFSLFDAKFWLDRPVLELLFVGFAAIQAAPEDVRTAFVELRIARDIEEMKLTKLAVSYYNRIGLLNFFQGEVQGGGDNQSIGEQAMLGKARCLKNLEDWVSADHLYRELCKRTLSPLVKSQAAVGWGEMALQFGQNREAQRRFDLAYPQMLSEEDRVRYSLGRLRLEGQDQVQDATALENGLALLHVLPPQERRDKTIELFNETFEFLLQTGDQRAIERLIDLAYQSEFADWLPILGYVLRLHENDFQREKLAGVGASLRDKTDLAGASMLDLAQMVERLDRLAAMVQRHEKKAAK